MNPQTPLSLSASTTFAPSSVTCKLKATPMPESRMTYPPSTRTGQAKDDTHSAPIISPHSRQSSTHNPLAQHQELLQQHQLQQKRQQAYQIQSSCDVPFDPSNYNQNPKGIYHARLSANPINRTGQLNLPKQNPRRPASANPLAMVPKAPEPQPHGAQKGIQNTNIHPKAAASGPHMKKPQQKKPRLDEEAKKIQALWRGYRCRRNLRLAMKDYLTILREIEGRSADVYNSLGKTYSWPIHRRSNPAVPQRHTNSSSYGPGVCVDTRKENYMENCAYQNFSTGEPQQVVENTVFQSEAERTYRIEKLQREMEWARKTLQARKEYLARCRQAASSSHTTQHPSHGAVSGNVEQACSGQNSPQRRRNPATSYYNS